MASPQEKSQIVLWCAGQKFVVKAKKIFHEVYKKNPAQARSIKEWHETFLEMGSAQKRSRGDYRSQCDARVEELREAFFQRPRPSIRPASSESSLVCYYP